MLVKRLRHFAFNKTPISLHTRKQIFTSNPIEILDEFQFHLSQLHSSSSKFTKHQAAAFNNSQLLLLAPIQLYVWTFQPKKSN